MLTIITSQSKPFRKKHLEELLDQYAPTDVITFDDIVLSIADLEQYVFPSLFNSDTTFIHAQFVLDTKEKDLTAELMKKLIASPSVFVFEELGLSKPFLTAAKKQGAIVHADEKEKAPVKKENLFGVTSLLSLPKKDRWMAYQNAIAQYPIEAILGMLYWKVRDLALKEKSNNGPYHLLYTSMIEAHANAWVHGTPLVLAIEKVLLQ
ncbi:MAG TPA: hypothetical protein VL576_01320 [Candidatus Paceibacterota bacterium]|jgi:hypothetical protein|nr:hypothetical protein [Candidatus Paceibacterota bacterium]